MESDVLFYTMKNWLRYSTSNIFKYLSHHANQLLIEIEHVDIVLKVLPWSRADFIFHLQKISNRSLDIPSLQRLTGLFSCIDSQTYFCNILCNQAFVSIYAIISHFLELSTCFLQFLTHFWFFEFISNFQHFWWN